MAETIKTLPGAEHLAALADHAALADLGTTPAPDRVTHLWRFSDPSQFAPESYDGVAGEARRTDGADAAAVVDLIPGLEPLVSLGEAARAAGLEILPLAQAGFATEHLGSAESAPESAWFTRLNDAAWNTGVALRVPRGQTVAGPIRVVVHADAAATLPRILLIVEENAEAELVEDHRGGAAGVRTVGVTEILASPASRVRHVLVQAWAPEARGHLSVRTRADRDADVLSVFAVLGGERAKLELLTSLDGRGARSRMVGVTLGAERQHLDLHTRHVHRAGGTASDIDVKAVVSERARSSYTGLIRIDEDARETEAFQENRNLLLSESARADTIPELEILNQEVSCSHGATVAPLDANQVFYLQSRGVPAARARRMIVRGFLENTLARLPESLRDDVETLVDRRLDAVEEAGR